MVQQKLTKPKRERKLDENKIVGVRLGVNISATCALYDPEDLDNKYVLYSSGVISYKSTTSASILYQSEHFFIEGFVITLPSLFL